MKETGLGCVSMTRRSRRRIDGRVNNNMQDRSENEAQNPRDVDHLDNLPGSHTRREYHRVRSYALDGVGLGQVELRMRMCEQQGLGFRV